MGINKVFSGADSWCQIKPYVSTDASQTEFKPIDSVIFYSNYDTISISSTKQTLPVFTLGNSSPSSYTEGPELIRMRATFAHSIGNPFFTLYDFILKSKYPDMDQNSYRNYSDEDRLDFIRDNAEDILANSGSLNGITTNPYDLWIYDKVDNIVQVTILLGVKIDTSTIAKDVLNKTVRLIEANVISHIDELDEITATKILYNTKDYQSIIKRITSNKSRLGRMPFDEPSFK